MSFRYFKEPKFHDLAFYKDIPVSDHIHENGHRERLLKSIADVLFVFDVDPNVKTLCDLGCGNGGMLWELGKNRPWLAKRTWGYDIQPKATEYGRDKYGVDCRCLDFVNELDKVEFGDIITLNETLEHLVNPHGLLEKLRGKSKWIVASVPAFENLEHHYIHHLWSFPPADFVKIFEKRGYVVHIHYVFTPVGTQYLIARNA